MGPRSCTEDINNDFSFHSLHEDNQYNDCEIWKERTAEIENLLMFITR